MVIARIWKGAVRREDGDAYSAYMQATGVPGYATTPGNLGVYMLRREDGDRSEFVMVSLWDSIESIIAFAGEAPEKAVFYPEDDGYLVERDLVALHYEVDAAAGPERGPRTG